MGLELRWNLAVLDDLQLSSFKKLFFGSSDSKWGSFSDEIKFVDSYKPRQHNASGHYTGDSTITTEALVTPTRRTTHAPMLYYALHFCRR